MAKETVLYPGVFTETCETRGRKTIEDVVRKVLLANGYPVIGNTCNQPDLCDLLTGCGFSSSTLCFLNGLEGVGDEGDCVRLGGDLIQDTTINTNTFDFFVTKDNVRIEVNDSGLPSGSGETARLYGSDGDTVAETGVYTTTGVPKVASRTYNATSDIYQELTHEAALEQLEIRTGLAANNDFMGAILRIDEAKFGHFDTTDTTIEVIEQAYTGGTHITKMTNLPTFANNAAAVTGLLPVDTIYKTATGELRIVI